MSHHSLRWRFTLGFITLQLVTIIASFGLVLYIATLSAPRGAVPSAWYPQEISNSVTVGHNGKATIDPTPALKTVLHEWPTSWFLIRFADGSTLRHGEMPKDIAENAAFLTNFRSVELRGYIDAPDRQATVDTMSTAAGEATVLAGGVSMSLYQLVFVVGQITIGVPALILLVVTLFGVPWVTKWSLRSLRKLTDRLNKVDFQARGGVVDENGLPKELLRVVREINLALNRLDAGFEKTERFFVNAAHELRTPIAIVQVRADTLPQSDEKLHIQKSIRRLTAITNQLLEIERYRQNPPISQTIELDHLLSKVVADLAPFAISEGYEISFDTDVFKVPMEGDDEALQRAFSNLVRNAIRYGGGRGDIAVKVEADGSVLISDQGIGIAQELHSRIFEPFFRVNPHGSGAGLGLSMVNEIIGKHGGFIELRSSPGQGSVFIIRWRNALRVEMHRREHQIRPFVADG
ncbi:signal transduction histidine kinase [Neorhizobium huautlense]|uniref:histidine kinase n=1 Tax=Neorhizobium huautlense TaxID=67774 RepID=A0ABT9PYF4_9HYPH|nr:HAMP domain-containing sensor histidine kinase [Neorhizobium huautlense]MDP9838764.1 signal transduction histidine kinase [Neorhizobium huautlense]